MIQVNIKYVYKARAKQGNAMMRMTLSCMVNRWGQVNYAHVFDIPVLENGKIGTKVKSVSCLQQDTKISRKSLFDLDF